MADHGSYIFVPLKPEHSMSRLSTLCAVAILTCGSAQAFADASSHAADAERFLQLAQADKLVVPVYAQVQQMFAQRFAESSTCNTELDRAVAWDKVEPDMIKLYTSNFNEQEMQELVSFYQSPLGQKVLQKMPMLTEKSAQMTQGKLETAVPKVNKLLADMTAELGPKKP